MDKPKEKCKVKFQLKQRRIFSVELKKKLVEQIETKKFRSRSHVIDYAIEQLKKSEKQ